jgi:membrane protein required for colicin V production
MTTVDWIIIAVAGFSILLGLLRGVVREVLSLAGWIVGIVLAFQYSEALGAALPIEMPASGLRTALGAVLIVILALLVAALIGAALRALLTAVRLSAADRMLGAGFGALRALLVVGLLVLVASATEAPRETWWKESALLPWVQAGVAFASPWLSDAFTRLPAGPG